MSEFWPPEEPPDVPKLGDAQSYKPIYCGPCLDKGNRIIVGHILTSRPPNRGLCVRCRAARLLNRR